MSSGGDPTDVGRWFGLRSAFWTVLLVPFLFLPYRWLWVPCGLAGMLLLMPGKFSKPAAVRRDGTLIFGAPAVLVLRTALDPGWWGPWIVLLVFLFWLRSRPWWTPKAAVLLTPALWVGSGCLLARPTARCPLGQTTRQIDKQAVLVCAGDSLTAGLDIYSDKQTYVARLRERLGCEVINAGFAGNGVSDLLDRLERDVLSHKPTAVLVFIGGNDYLDGRPRRQFAEQLETIVARLAATGCRLVIVEVPTGIIWDPYAGIYRRIAGRHGAVLVPESALRWWFSLELLGRRWLDEPVTLDGLHLSEAGARTVADWLEPYVVRALLGR